MTTFEKILERLLICWHVLTKKNYVFFALDNDAIRFDENGKYSDVDANKLAEFDYFDKSFNVNSKYGLRNIGWFVWGSIADFAYQQIRKED